MTANPHPAALTPEYRAAMALEDIEGSHIDMIARDPRDGEFRVNHQAVAIIADAIRAAVMAERTRYIVALERLRPGVTPIHEHNAIIDAAIRSTETDHDR